MTISTGERALLGIKALLMPIRTASGYQTEVGADVALSLPNANISDDLYWRTLVYVADEVINDGAGIAGNFRTYSVKLTINIDVLTRSEDGNEGQQIERIKSEVRAAMLPQSGILLESGTRVGSLHYTGNLLITDLLSSGVLGLRSTVIVKFTEDVTH